MRTRAPFGIVLAALVAVGALGAAGAQHGAIAGTIGLTDAEGEILSASGVRLTVSCDGTDISRAVVSDERGEFRFTDLPAGSCTIVTDLQGFVPAIAHATVVADDTVTLKLALHTVPVRAGILVARSTTTPRFHIKHATRCGR